MLVSCSLVKLNRFPSAQVVRGPAACQLTSPHQRNLWMAASPWHVLGKPRKAGSSALGSSGPQFCGKQDSNEICGLPASIWRSVLPDGGGSNETSLSSSNCRQGCVFSCILEVNVKGNVKLGMDTKRRFLAYAWIFWGLSFRMLLVTAQERGFENYWFERWFQKLKEKVRRHCITPAWTCLVTVDQLILLNLLNQVVWP